MRKIPLSRSLLYFLDEVEFSDAGLSADPDAAPLAAPFQDAIAEWEPIFKTVPHQKIRPAPHEIGGMGGFAPHREPEH